MKHHPEFLEAERLIASGEVVPDEETLEFFMLVRETERKQEKARHLLKEYGAFRVALSLVEAWEAQDA